tara:strand:+ start:313 stop:489 length:177 start_codon:yes stop_codon:yes gene_type:complete
MIYQDVLPISWLKFKKDPTTTLMGNIEHTLIRYIKDKDGLALGSMNEQSRRAELFWMR